MLRDRGLQNDASEQALTLIESGYFPPAITRAGERATRRFAEFFGANIRNKNTRAAYARAVTRFFTWCDERSVSLKHLDPITVAAYIETHPGSKPTIKQHLAALRMLFDWLVTGQIIPLNPAASVRGPKHIVKKGKTPVLAADQARTLLDSIKDSTIAGLRDRALIAVMVYSFARVSAVIGMRVCDYYADGKRWWLRLHEKGGKFHEVPVHHIAEAYLDAYLDCADIRSATKSPLFRSTNRAHTALTAKGMTRTDVFRMIKRRARNAGLPASTCCHTFRATGITVYLSNGGTLENAQAIAAHESPKTTKLYDRTKDAIALDEIERILI